MNSGKKISVNAAKVLMLTLGSMFGAAMYLAYNVDASTPNGVFGWHYNAPIWNYGDGQPLPRQILAVIGACSFLAFDVVAMIFASYMEDGGTEYTTDAERLMSCFVALPLGSLLVATVVDLVLKTSVAFHLIALALNLALVIATNVRIVPRTPTLAS